MTEEKKNPDDQTNEPIDLTKIEDADIKSMNAADLAEFCGDQGLKKKGRKEELIARLMTKKYGQSGRYIQGLTKCRFCQADVVVTGTKKQPDGEGKTMITRQIKCRGKHSHRYPLKEIVKAD